MIQPSHQLIHYGKARIAVQGSTPAQDVARIIGIGVCHTHDVGEDKGIGLQVGNGLAFVVKCEALMPGLIAIREIRVLAGNRSQTNLKLCLHWVLSLLLEAPRCYNSKWEPWVKVWTFPFSWLFHGSDEGASF